VHALRQHHASDRIDTATLRLGLVGDRIVAVAVGSEGDERDEEQQSSDDEGLLSHGVLRARDRYAAPTRLSTRVRPIPYRRERSAGIPRAVSLTYVTLAGRVRLDAAARDCA